MAFLARETLEEIGFSELGEDVLISDKASIYNPRGIAIGNHVRIDDFCVLAAGIGGIKIGSFVHIAVGSTLIGACRITLSDFSGLSSRVSIYSSSDDYSGKTLTNPTVPDRYKAVAHEDVFLGRHVIVGSGSVILPGVILEEGVAIGALSLVNKHCEAFGIYAGNPVKRIKARSRLLLDLEQEFINDQMKNKSESI
ncbi:MAG: acyltransferase [Methylococcus sp.]|nr:acyltransferase [Methylococcus sp.]